MRKKIKEKTLNWFECEWNYNVNVNKNYVLNIKEFIVFNIEFFSGSSWGVNKWYGKSGQLPLVTKDFSVVVVIGSVSMCLSALCTAHNKSNIVNFNCAWISSNFIYDFNGKLNQIKWMSILCEKKYGGGDVMPALLSFGSFVCMQ